MTRPNVQSVALAHDIAAIERFVKELQHSYNAHDAEAFNRHFAGDIVWGNPNGGVVEGGFETLHDTHKKFFSGKFGNAYARYELVKLNFLGAEIAVAHVTRVATDVDGTSIDPTAQDSGPGFNEIAMYVMAKRNGEWWLAAGQNTPIRATG